MATSEARKRANKKWNDAHLNERYDHLHVVLPAGRKANLDAFAREQGISTNGLVNSVLQRELGMSDEEWKAKEGENDGWFRRF